MPPAPEFLPPKAPARTALLVEDDAVTLRFYLAGLKGLGEFRLLASGNGAEALATLKETPVDVVVTDLNMPVLDGYGLITALAERYPSLPVIVLTSEAKPSMLHRAEELGALRVLAKPPKLSLLMEEIRNAAARQPQGLVEGLSLAGLLQLLNWERQTATLTVRGAEGVGYLYVRDGELIQAALQREEGLAAAYRILAWGRAHVEFVNACRVPAAIALPLAEVLLNAAVLQDQRRAAPPARTGPDAAAGPEAGPARDPWTD